MASSQAIDIGNVLVISTIILTKQMYNGKVKLFSEIELFPLRLSFPFHYGF